MTGSKKRIVTTAEIESGIHTISIAHPGQAKNWLDSPTLEQLDQAIDQLTESADVKGIVIQSTLPGQFLAGADLAAIQATTDFADRDIEAFCRMGRTIFEKLHQCDAVTVAAIDGLTENGGLELALWSDFRIATNAIHTQFSFSDVGLGLLPAWGGSVLLPRICSIDFSLRMIAIGGPVSAEEAHAGGLVDQIVDDSHLLPAAIELIQKHVDNKTEVAQRRQAKTAPVKFNLENNVTLRERVAAVGTEVGEATELYPFAPTVAIEHILRTASEEFDAALESETAAVVQVYGSPANKGLLNHYFLVQRNATEPGLVDLNLTASPIKKLGIVGAGVMGRSIAHVALGAGIDVALIDASKNAIAIAQSELSAPEFQIPDRSAAEHLRRI